ACDMAQEEDFVWLEENLTLQEFYLKNNLIQKLLELDNALHRKMFSICRKDLIYRMSQGLSIHYDRVRNMEATTIHGHKTVEDHRNLVKAIRNKDKELAKKIMEEHLDRWLMNEQTLRKQYPQYFKT
ncbi:MAG: FCD domain-containing protein, partial [Clostridium sp.]|nr:FCD domain-containing protein [Clostridium sp.]